MLDLNITLIGQSQFSGLRVYQIDTQQIIFVVGGIIVAECGYDDFIAGAAYFAALA